MQSLDAIRDQIADQKLPPVESWNPKMYSEMDLVIRYDGRWIHQGAEIQRQPLVKLFSSILRREGDDYYLVTPVEKVKISVENTPFIVVSAELIDHRWFMTNNLGDVKELTGDCCLDVSDDQNPKLDWRSQLMARVNQNVMYQWQNHALDHDGLQFGQLWLESGADKILIAST